MKINYYLILIASYEVCIGIYDSLPQDGSIWGANDINCDHDFWNLQLIYYNKVTGMITSVFKLSLNELIAAQYRYALFLMHLLKHLLRSSKQFILDLLIVLMMNGLLLKIVLRIIRLFLILNRFKQDFCKVRLPALNNDDYNNKLGKAICLFKENAYNSLVNILS